ncbi:TPA: HNH endonuclease [Vibrio vulnificus]|nr:HNH endonuclease [Vibrio sp. Vb1980]MDW1977407.1 HNH endonuclease [Vibrio sp. Vb1980]HDY7455821.1 HNH endonuclease [Vibrio vulnificus]
MVFLRVSQKKKIANWSEYNEALCKRGSVTFWIDESAVEAWSKGGSTDISNCEMLCKTHNRAKGNK